MTYIDTRTLNDELTDLESRDQALRDHLENFHGWSGLDDVPADELEDRHTTDHDLHDAERESFTLDEHTDDLDQHETMSTDDVARLAALRAVRDEIGDEFEHGETMVPDDEFEDYAEELAGDLGLIPEDASWPVRHIDWEAAADELRQDYTEVEFDGVTYLVRA